MRGAALESLRLVGRLWVAVRTARIASRDNWTRPERFMSLMVGNGLFCPQSGITRLCASLH